MNISKELNDKTNENTPNTAARVSIISFLLIIKKYHRQFLYALLALLFILDIITTAIGLGMGYFEQNFFMMRFVENPFLHLFVKIIAYGLAFLIIEGSLLLIQKLNHNRASISYKISYSFILFGLLYFNWIFINIVCSNILVILR